MDNSLERLFDAMMKTLGLEIIPRIDDAFARGQAIAIVDILRNLGPRVEWSQPMLWRQIDAQEAVIGEIHAFCADSQPAIPVAPGGNFTTIHPGAAELMARREELEAHICALLRWVAKNRQAFRPGVAGEIEDRLGNYMKAQLERELALTASPLLAEISRGKN